MSYLIKNPLTDDLLVKDFFILGIDTDKIIDTNYFSNIKNISDSHKLTPSILSFFPSFPKNSIYIDESLLLHHCFPNGFYIKKFNQFPFPEHFTFELSNFPLNNKQSSLYFTCLSFYEPIENYNLFKIIHDKGAKFAQKYLQTPQNSQNDNLYNNDIGITCPLIGQGYYIEKVIGFISGEYHPKVLTKILYLLHGKYTGHFNEIKEPLEKIIESLIFKIPAMKFGKCKLEVRLFKKEHYFEYQPVNSVPLSDIEINKLFERYDVNDILQIFKYLLLEEPILIFSEKKSELTSAFDSLLSLLYPFKYIQPHCSILPNNSFGLIESCDKFIFGINQSYSDDFFRKNEISIFNKKIIILDLDKKAKYIFKKFDVIQIDLDNDFNEDFELFNEKDIKNKDDLKYNYRNINYHKSQNLEKKEIETEIELPTHYKKKTHNILLDYIKSLGKYQNQNTYYSEIDNFNHKIKEQFSYFLVSILLDYPNFIKYDFETVDNYLLNPENDFIIDNIFDVEGFINMHKVDELFYRKFFQTNIFKYFIIKKIYPINLEDKIDILYFDERIADKNNKYIFGNKVDTPFMYYQFNSTEQKIFIESEYFSINEINFIQNDSYNIKNHLKYYQVVITNLNNQISIKYPVFPKLLYDDFYFGQTYFELYRINNIPPLNVNLINQKIKEIYKLIKSPEFNSIYKSYNYSLNNYDESNLLKIEQKDYLSNIWVALNALTLNYCKNDEEKNSRFSEIIEKLYDSYYIDIEIITLILIVISKYGTSEQLLITFVKILKNKILLKNYTLHSILITNLTKSFNSDNLSSKTNIISSRAAILNKKDSNMELINLENLTFSKRGIYSQDENTQESIEFGLKTMCCHCRRLNEIEYELLLKIKGKPNGVLLQCGNCKKSFSPRIKVNIDNKIIESFELISCWDMLQFIKNEFMTNNKFNIDVINFKKNYNEFFWNAVFYFSLNELNFDFLTPYVKDISNNSVQNNYRNENTQEQFSELFYENTSNVFYNQRRMKGNMASNYKNPYIKMNSGKK